VNELTRLLRDDEDVRVRAEAAHGLGVSHRPEAREPLLNALASEPDEGVRERSREALRWVEHNGPPPTHTENSENR
jgi:HEAT repeat protein